MKTTVNTNKTMAMEKLVEELRRELPAPFPVAEYEARWARVREAMAVAGVDTLLVSNPADICYLTGAQTSWYHDGGPAEWVPESAVALRVDEPTPLVFDDEDESLLILGTAHAPNLRVLPNAAVEAALEGVGRLAPDEAGFAQASDYVVEILRDDGWLRGRIGLQLGSYRPNPRYTTELTAKLQANGGMVVDGTAVMPSVTRYKSPLELACVREAARIGDAGFLAAAGTIAEGVTELEVWAAATSAMAALGGELSALPGMVNSGPKNACLHGLAGRRRLCRGDIVNIDMCGVYNRYHSNLARSIYLGEPPGWLRTAMDRPRQLAEAVRSEMRPGMALRELLELNERLGKKLGIWQDQWWLGGYDLGIALAPDWVGYHYFSAELDPGEQTLEPGMVMNTEWNFYLPRGAGVRELIDTIIVTEDAVEFPHKVPLELVVVPQEGGAAG